jgi:hypothetical protein
LIHHGKIIAKACNDPTEEKEDMCDPICIRLKIQSRTEQMLGACDHAEEWAMRKAVMIGVPLQQCELYVAGFKFDCLPNIAAEPEFTCLRCASEMDRYGVGLIYVPVDFKWMFLNSAQAVRTAKAYALGEKKA